MTMQAGALRGADANAAAAPSATSAGATVESSHSAVSWPAIFAGAAVAFAFGFTLLALGAGVGLASVSPYGGASAAAFTASAAVWLIVVQWLSSALGGFVTGRLRTKWTNLHTDEVMFRDTAHGLLSWAVAVGLGAAVLGITASVVSAVNRDASDQGHVSYYADEMFRSTRTTDTVDAKKEAGRILMTAAGAGGVSDADKTYLGELVQSRAGVPAAEAGRRVDAVLTQAKADTEKARKTASAASVYTFFSLMIGAFIACVAGAIGGRQRDLY